VVLDVQPVAHVLAFAADRQRPVLEAVEDHQRDPLLWKLVGAVVVGAVGEHDRQSVGVVPSHHQMFGSRLGGGVGEGDR
jgi:hypothetical protein